MASLKTHPLFIFIITIIIILIIIIMVMKMFVDREEELREIRERLSREGFELIVIYGRRRIGKTSLALEAVKGLEHIYYLAIEGDNLRHFKRRASEKIPKVKYAEEDWEAIFHFLRDKIVIIDEFQNLIKEDPKVLSKFQRIVDVMLKGTNAKVILLGSSVSMVRDKVLSYNSPLYGRRTASMKLRPLKFVHLSEFFPKAGRRELVEIFGFADGIPFYLERVRTPFWKWLQGELSMGGSFLLDEVDFMLKYEFSEVSTYKKILEAIAWGKNTMKEIKDYSGLKYSDITPYLRNLMEVEMVRKEVPVTDPQKSRRGRYYLSDNFLSFWFRYIFPNLSSIEEGLFDVGLIRRDYDQYLGQIYERIGREFVADLAKKGKLPLRPQIIGKWWHKGEEIDLVLIDEKRKKAMLGEVKWKDLEEKEIYRILNDLERKAEKIPLEGYEIQYFILGRKIQGKEEVEECLLYDLEDILPRVSLRPRDLSDVYAEKEESKGHQGQHLGPDHTKSPSS